MQQRAKEKEMFGSLCILHVQSRCARGDSCKFSHDLDAYVARKPPDLPGLCPFTWADAENGCPYGVTCRWATTHTASLPPSIAVATETETKVKALQPNEWWHGDDSIPRSPCCIPPAKKILSSFNTLSKDIQIRLRKNEYDFARADRVLEALNIPNKAAARGKPKGSESPVGRCAKRAKVEEEGEFVEYVEVPDGKREKQRSIDFRGKTFLAPLTTVGNLPFRRLCKTFGADITCGEMALATNLLQGQASEWALLRRHESETCFGVQVCGGFGDAMTRCAQLISEQAKQVDFVDINFGCPIDVVTKKGAGSACLLRPNRMADIIKGMSSVLSCPITLKMRKGYHDGGDVAHEIIPQVASWGASVVTLHGRTREQRYSRLADWEYIRKCADTDSVQVIGNGDVLSWQDHQRAVEECGVATTYIARGALIKPWIFQEIKESRDWDISASERLDIVRNFVSYGLEHWGSDGKGVESTRRFLLEWLSFAHRYIPVGLLERLPAAINWRPPAFVGRNDLETLLSSPDPRDWIKISELFLGPVPLGFQFTPKHKATSYAAPKEQSQENG